MDDTMMAAALAYAERGWPVFPCHTIRDGKCSCGKKCGSPGKHPLTKNGHTDATTDPAIIRKWWGRNPDANIAYAVQPDVAVLDVDVKPQEGKHGDETLAALEAIHGGLPDTVRSLTGGGGVQHFFSCDPALGLTCSNPIRPKDPEYESIDFKTKGGYVILPPSRHISGRQYEWEVCNDPNDLELATLPQWIIDARIAPKGTTVHTVVPAKDAEGAKVYEGQRNDILFRLASSLRAKGLSEAAMLAALMEENKARCEPPLPEDEVRKLTHSAGRYEQGEVLPEWEPIIPFNVIDTPAFPTDALPAPIADFVDALSISTQTPNEMGAVLSLGVLASAFQKRYTVQVTADWKEQLSLYTVAIAPPGERKTAVISALMAPVYAYERMRRDLEGLDIAQNQAEKAMLEKALSAAQSNAGKAKDAQAMEWSREKVRELAAELAEFKDMHPFRMVVDDTTPEKLIDIMDMQGGCITIASAEGGIFDSLSGRYDKGANFDIYLKGHAGDPVSVERIGRGENYIPNPRLTMILTIQPEVLNGLIGNATFKGRGLCGRFLYAICKSKVGHREINPAAVPQPVREAYDRFVGRILGDQGEGLIYLSPEADQLRQEYQSAIERRLGNAWEFMCDWGGKLVGAMVRIAALLHASEVKGDPTTIPIQAGIMEAAIRIAEFFGPHAEAAYQVMGADERQADARYILRMLENERPTEITRSALLKLCEGRYRSKADQLDPVMARLEEYGYVRITTRDIGYNNRKQTIYLINPNSWSATK